ncbi:PREDICTED: 1-aminocyclopropane-1-carboxylate oxidase homolog [Fragaria vesca subsp. vesca]|uniref:1-aminocyclopropane-1-carboxylate oxidase homolog n=1 Tax=Fragaria vesca subsp. vesca TaxID=101020 RepID=UPI0002C351A5|nr:PREDICTED: 1-aminocyclopropane-1-carboxylate oxidase homolog [Fragaria vesca subsp. vesca]XP_011464570.1 PREDICTED: 1-aminocyclopropane-1-carboxylate oxidase homolog [Fragaria vesca subsp. vesca]
MAPTTTAVADETKVASIKTLTDTGAELNSVPSEYTYVKDPNDQADASDPEHSIPTIDFAHLTSSNPKLRADAIEKLGKACEEWGFFQVINHGVPESLMKSMIEACHKFFQLPEEEKKEFQSRKLLEPIKCGTSFNVAIDKVRLWRDYLKVIAHPEFHSLHKPAEYSDVSFEFSKQTRQVATELLSGISESLGLEAEYIAKAMNWDRGMQILAANYYPACPQPDLAIGIPPHTDHGLVTLLIQNDMGGLEVQHNGKWVLVDCAPGAFVVNIGDQMQILTNDKYKSVWHRAVVNNRATRISIAVPHGPALDTAALPIPELLGGEAPKYIGMSYEEFMELQASPAAYMMPCLDHLRVKAE